MLVQSEQFDTRMILLCFGIVDAGGECECCRKHTFTLDTYIHNGRLAQYCGVCAGVFAINGQDIHSTVNTDAIIVNKDGVETIN